MFGTIYSLYVLSMLWTLLGAQGNRTNLCGLSGQNMSRLNRAFSIGEFLYVGDGTEFYPLELTTLENKPKQFVNQIFAGEFFNRLFADHKL